MNCPLRGFFCAAMWASAAGLRTELCSGHGKATGIASRNACLQGAPLCLVSPKAMCKAYCTVLCTVLCFVTTTQVQLRPRNSVEAPAPHAPLHRRRRMSSASPPPKRITFMRGLAEATDFPDASWDLVVFSFVIHECPQVIRW